MTGATRRAAGPALAVALVAAAACGPGPQASDGVWNVWAVAATSPGHLIVAGETRQGDLVVLRSDDDGKTWSARRPAVPALTTIAIAGDRLIGSLPCLRIRFADTDVRPAPASCLYASDDGGGSWRDLNVGQIVDPEFADASHGWAHSPVDFPDPPPSTLYATEDGGRTWHAIESPCDPGVSVIAHAVPTGQGAGYVACVAAPQASSQAWDLIELRPDAPPRTLLSSPSDLESIRFGGFDMGAGGVGFLWAGLGANRYTSDGGATWQEVVLSDARRGGFEDAVVVDGTHCYAAIRDGGVFTGIDFSTDGCRSWFELATWPWVW